MLQPVESVLIYCMITASQFQQLYTAALPPSGHIYNVLDQVRL